MKSFPLSQTQLGIYATCVNQQEDGNYNIDVLYHLTDDVDLERFAAAIDKVVECHPYLKSGLATDDDGNVVIVDRREAEYHTEIRRVKSIDDVRPTFGQNYDLNTAPWLFRFEIYQTEEGNYFFFDVHHIIFDGLSYEVFISDVEKAYAGEALEPEVIDGFQIAQEEEALRATEAYSEARDWYNREFCNCSELEPMPPRDVYGDDTKNFIKIAHKIGVDAEQVETASRNAGVRPSMLFTAAFGYTLSLFTGDEEAVYTTVYHGRSDRKTRRSVDMMVKTLPVYHDFRQVSTVGDLLRQTSTQIAESRKRTCYSFGEICHDLGVNSAVCFAYQGVVTDFSIYLDGVRQSYESMIVHSPGIRIRAELCFRDGEYLLELEYSQNRYSADYISNFCNTYSKVVSEMLVKEKLSEMELCTAEQLAQLDSFNKKDRAPESYDTTIVELFRKAAAAYPDNIAVVYKEKRYSYRELDEATDKLALYIHRHVDTSKENPVVSIIIGRSEMMAIASLAALKAGCAYQPLDPSYPKERLNFMVADAGAQLLIADEALREIVDEYAGEVLLTKDIPAILNEKEQPDFRQELMAMAPKPDSLFILLYTSGTTGQPKGVMLEHHNIVAFCRWYHHYYDLRPEHNVAAYASYGFDANMMDTYPALTRGATLDIIAEEMRLDLVGLNEYFEAHHITHSLMTTQVGVQFLLNMENHSLQHLTVGGEKLVSVDPPAGYKLYNAYGPTECTIITTIKQVTENEPNIPIGRPLDALKCYVVDKAMRRLPAGAIGELAIVGSQVARGYLNRPDKTAEAFFTYNGEPAYHSGDIVRYRSDGDVEFIGRKDGQVKIRGFRIELKEVEAVIRDFDGVKDATVQAFDDANGGKFIAAYVVYDGELNVDELNSFIAGQKPPYMVPAVTMQIDKIPLNVNQKVDKRALPKPEAKAIEKKAEATAPLNALEEELKAIIAGVVKTDEFSITDILGFFGLTSISSIRLATLIYKKYGVQVDSKTLATGSLQSIENIIIRSLLERKDAPEETPALGSQQPESVQTAELTYPQLGVYFDCMKNPGSVMYNVPFMYTFPEEVTASQLVAAVKATVENHQSFKLIFKNRDGKPTQMLAEDREVVVPTVSMTGSELEKYKREFVRPFNLSEGPLYRFEVVEVADEAHRGVTLLADVHHLATDGGSFDVMLREITARLSGAEVEVESYPYLKFAADQKAAEASEQYQAAKQFFDDELKTCEGASEITGDLKKVDGSVNSLGNVSFPVDGAKVDALAKELGITAASVYLAATFYAVSRYINNKDVYFGTISNGRSDLKTYNTTGMFVNTLALHSHIGDQTVSEYIRETAANFTETLKHEQYPFAQIAADYGFRPEIVFEYQVGVMTDYLVNGKPVIPEGLQLDLAKFKIKIAIFDRADGGREVTVGYDESLYTRELVEGLAESVSAVVDHFIAEKSTPVKRISIMSNRQRDIVDKMRNVAKADVPFSRFYEPIEKYAVIKSDDIALIACDRTLTYAEFNSEANRIAHALMQRGVKHGDRVVLLLPRTSAVMLSIFGVSKAGAAFIPCDPEYPADRISLIIEDSEAAYVITTAEHMAEHEGKAINVEELLSADCPTTNPNVAVDPDDLVYLIYTSGSTGRPKGVMLRHCAICNYLYDHPANIHIHALNTDHVKAYLSITTLSFDMSLKEYGVALHNGVTLVLANEEEVNNPMLLAELFARTGAEVINGTPSRLLSYMELPAFCDALSKCKMVWSGGEKYSEKLLQRLHDMGVRIFNTYGPTEITVSCNGGELTNQKTVSVGRPLLNYTEFIVDSDGNELPVGVVGELYIGGIGVAKGYNNLPEQTAERFIEYQGHGLAPVRVYRSGDYARWRADGQVDILGRTDNQVKLRGLRIELGEVESAISRVEGMKQVVVMIRTISGREHLSAFFTADRPMDVEAIKAEIGETLTHYMVPTAYLQLDKMPLTPNGKTDLKHLPEPIIAQSSSEYVAPKNKAEQDFCEIFGKVLELEKVSAADSFFELGGTSLNVTRVIIEATNLGYNVAYSDVFKNPTAQKLAALLSDDSTDYSDPEVTDYDYTAINELLQQNTLENFRKGERLQLGDVLLTCANGYLGIHVLHELLKDTNSNRQIYCLVRHSRGGLTSEERLKNLLFYYFEDNYKDLFGTRLHVIDGDVTDSKALDAAGKVDTVINCAAIVKHFSEGTEIEDINIGGLQNCVDYCLRTGAKLVQTSTFSISGQSVNGVPSPSTNYSEQMLYFGQWLSSKYTHSKFLAERILLEAVATKGLVGKIVRLGNLAPRAVDGEFQINFGTNSAMGRLHVFQMLGVCSYSQAMGQMEFSPIDEVAQAVLLLATTPKECTVFHPFNNHVQLMGDVVREMAITLGTQISEVEDDEFQTVLQTAGQDPEKAQILQSMLAYNASGKDVLTGFSKYNPYTCNVLARMGFHWNATSWDYVRRFIEAMASLDFFEDKRW
jgi:amino acid adenylation domain-containing protein